VTAGDEPAGAPAAEPGRRRTYSFTRAVSVGGGGFSVGLLPMCLTGALGVQLTTDLRFGAFGLGAAIAAFRATSAFASPLAGRLADQLGASRSLRLAAGAAGAASLGIALTARNWLSLAAWLAVAGAAMALAEPAANRLLVNTVPEKRLGTAFGLKQSAAPAATMLAGFSVPWIAVHFGWRVAFVIGALVALAVVFGVLQAPPRQRPAAPGGRARRKRLRNPLMIAVLAAALGLGSASSSTVSSFYVVAAEHAGTAVETAGLLLALASIVTIVIRMVAGVIADRLPAEHLRISAAGQLAGCVGFGLLATNIPVVMAVGAVVSLACTWGFHGLSWFAMVRAYPDAPGAITGAIAPGALLGGVLGPLIYGSLAAGFGYGTGWLSGALMALLAAIALFIANGRLRLAPT
jgi:MFS family permease